MADIQEYADILDGRRSLEVEIVPGKPKLQVSYDSLRLTDEILDRLDEQIPDDAKDRKVIIAMLTEVGLEWKLARDGVPIPTTKDGLRSVSLRALRLVWEAILADSRDPGAADPKGATPPSSAASGAG
jgi:hypothetical protein